MTIAYDYKTRTSYTEDAAQQKAAHKILLVHQFEPSLPERGYTNRTLHIDLSTLKVTEKAVTQQMKDIFIGGRGFGLWYLWNAIKPTTKWNDPENDIVISPGSAGREHRVRRVGQVARRHAVAAHRHPDRQQRRRLLRPAPEVLRLRRPRDPGQGRAGRRRRHRRPEEDDHDRGGARGEPRQPRGRRGLHARVRRRREGLRQRVGRVGGQGRRAQPDRLPELLVVRPEARRGAAEAGRARRHRHGLPRQEDQGARRARLQDEGRPEPGRGLPADDEGRARAGEGDPRLRRPAVQDAEDRHGAPGRGHGRLRPAAGAQLPVRQAHGHRQDPVDRVGEAVHAGDLRRLLVRLPHGVRQGRRLPQGDDRPLQGPHRHGGRAGVRDVRGPRVQLRHLRARLDPRVELLLRHLRHRHDLVRHLLRVRDGVLPARHPERASGPAASI